MSRLVLLIICLATAAPGPAAEANLNRVAADLTVPVLTPGAPAAARRVRATTAAWANTTVYHTLYLPLEWTSTTRNLPVIVEYAGNGGYRNALGDTSDGTVDGAMLGYGLSAGRGFIWVVLPFIERVGGEIRNATKWWGDITETKRYCIATVREVCRRYGGDPTRVVLAGFSRGAIACNYVGLHDDEIASLWCGLVAHSHYEGEFKHPAPDAGAWVERLRRLGTRPIFVSHELSVQKIKTAIAGSGVAVEVTYADLPFPNHSARWTLCDLPLRQQARAWLAATVRPRN